MRTDVYLVSPGLGGHMNDGVSLFLNRCGARYELGLMRYVSFGIYVGRRRWGGLRVEQRETHPSHFSLRQRRSWCGIQDKLPWEWSLRSLSSSCLVAMRGDVSLHGGALTCHGAHKRSVSSVATSSVIETAQMAPRGRPRRHKPIKERLRLEDL